MGKDDIVYFRVTVKFPRGGYRDILRPAQTCDNLIRYFCMWPDGHQTVAAYMCTSKRAGLEQVRRQNEQYRANGILAEDPRLDLVD